MKTKKSDDAAINVDGMEGFNAYFQEFTKNALEGPVYTREEAIKAMRPENHGKKLSEYYPDLEKYGL